MYGDRYAQYLALRVRPLFPWLGEVVFIDGPGSAEYRLNDDAQGRLVFQVPAISVTDGFCAHVAGHALHGWAAKLREAADHKGTAGDDIVSELQAIIAPGPSWLDLSVTRQKNECVAEAFRRAMEPTSDAIYANLPAVISPFPAEAVLDYFKTVVHPAPQTATPQPAADTAPAVVIGADPAPPHIEWIGEVPNTNYNPGRSGNPISLVVMHWMAGSFDSAVSRFRQYGTHVSAHYLIRQDGYIAQMVSDDDTAYHAGDWSTNQLSIGIEHEASPTMLPTDALYAASAWLLKRLAGTHSLQLVLGQTVLPHHAIVPTACPGTLDLERILREAGNDLAFRDDPDAKAYVQDARETFEAIKAELSRQQSEIDALRAPVVVTTTTATAPQLRPDTIPANAPYHEKGTWGCFVMEDGNEVCFRFFAGNNSAAVRI